MRYRADIDGLRAVAILAVVAFHLGITRFFGGGYVGVDIFFVLSGFLITRIVFDDIASQRYSITAFYRRRALRIFPALFVMLVATMAASLLLRSPRESHEVGDSVIAAVVFTSNLYFFFHSNYFDDKAISSPALHTWSLSVEEQFYILFPLLLIFMRGTTTRQKMWLLALAAAFSLIAAAVQMEMDASAAFYLVHCRAWELLLGGLVAIGLVPKLERQMHAEVVGSIGLGCIAYAVITYSNATPFPGVAALLPCVGTAAILHAGTGHVTWTGRLLSLPPMRYVGQISYSMYLWHWPLFVYYSDIYIVRSQDKFILLTLTFAFATASWWWVERPFRQTRLRLSPRETLTLSAGAMAACLLAAVVLGPIGSVLHPSSPRVDQLLAEADDHRRGMMGVGVCFLTPEFNRLSDYQVAKCLAPAAGKRNVLIVGDSHAAHLVHGYRQAFPDIHFLQATASGCKPVVNPQGESRCTQLMEKVFREFLPSHRVDAVILSARWLPDDVEAAVTTARALAAYSPRMVISGPVPEYEPSLPRLLARAVERNKDPSTYANAHRSSLSLDTDRIFRQQTMLRGVAYVSPYAALCNQLCTVLLDDGHPTQFDYGHLTESGSVYVAQRTGRVALGEQPLKELL